MKKNKHTLWAHTHTHARTHTLPPTLQACVLLPRCGDSDPHSGSKQTQFNSQFSVDVVETARGYSTWDGKRFQRLRSWPPGPEQSSPSRRLDNGVLLRPDNHAPLANTDTLLISVFAPQRLYIQTRNVSTVTINCSFTENYCNTVIKRSVISFPFSAKKSLLLSSQFFLHLPVSSSLRPLLSPTANPRRWFSLAPLASNP